MSKKFNPKNGKIKFLRWLAIFFIMYCLIARFLSPYLNIYLLLNIFPFLASSTNNTSKFFYGENIDMSQILPASQHYVLNKKGEDLIDIAANLGVNFVRITNAQRSFGNNADSIYTADQWNQVLNKMQSKGMKALILIGTDSNNADYYTPDIRPVYLHLVQKYIDSGVFSNPDVYAVDIENEPLLTDANIGMLQTAHAMIKEKYPDLKQTIGWWATPKAPADPYKPHNYNWSDYSAGKQIASIVDFFSLHMYGGLDSNNLGTGLNPDLRTKWFISQVENGLQTNKPILIEEFGEANGDAVSDGNTIGNPELQANIYQGVYQALQEMHSRQILGVAAFDFSSPNRTQGRNQYPDAWAIVKNNGNYLFPAAYILQEYALGKKKPALRRATVVTSQSYLVQNADNHTIQNLQVSDRIGLKLQFADNKKYLLSLSANGMLRPIESFHYEPDFDAYYAVYQASRAGNLQLNIMPASPCPANTACTSQVYSLTITIH